MPALRISHFLGLPEYRLRREEVGRGFALSPQPLPRSEVIREHRLYSGQFCTPEDFVRREAWHGQDHTNALLGCDGAGERLGSFGMVEDALAHRHHSVVEVRVLGFELVELLVRDL